MFISDDKIVNIILSPSSFYDYLGEDKLIHFSRGIIGQFFFDDNRITVEKPNEDLYIYVIAKRDGTKIEYEVKVGEERDIVRYIEARIELQKGIAETELGLPLEMVQKIYDKSEGRVLYNNVYNTQKNIIQLNKKKYVLLLKENVPLLDTDYDDTEEAKRSFYDYTYVDISRYASRRIFIGRFYNVVRDFPRNEILDIIEEQLGGLNPQSKIYETKLKEFIQLDETLPEKIYNIGEIGIIRESELNYSEFIFRKCIEVTQDNVYNVFTRFMPVVYLDLEDYAN